MIIIQRDHKNDESQFIFPHDILQAPVAFIAPPYLQPIRAVTQNYEDKLREFIICIKSNAREVVFYKNSIVVKYVHDREHLLDHCNYVEDLITNIFGAELKIE